MCFPQQQIELLVQKCVPKLKLIPINNGLIKSVDMRETCTTVLEKCLINIKPHITKTY